MTKQKPRVMILIDTYAVGGAGRTILQFLNHGGAEHAESVVVGFWRGPEQPWEFREAVEALGVEFEVLRQAHAFDPRVIGQAVRMARARKIQILQTHGYKAHCVGLGLRRLTGTPWMAFSHGWTTENRKVDLYNRIDQWIVQFADRIVPVARDVQAKLKLSERAASKAVVIPNAVTPVGVHRDRSADRSGLGVRDDETLFAVVGRLSPEKGQRSFIEAFRIVVERRGDVRAVIVGDGQERDLLTRMILNRGLGEQISLVGYQSDTARFYSACDVVVIPSLREGMPNVALEAMSHGRAVVATNVGGIPEVVLDGETGILVDSENSSALAGALLQLVGDPAMTQRLGLAGRTRAESGFAPEARTLKIAELLNEMLAV
jgi:glycosyltransferase involved in cell wall biosynthesis